MGLPRVVREYEDVFSEEISGLPPHRDVEFVIKIHLDTSPISMTPHRMVLLSCRNSKSDCKNCWTWVLLDQALNVRDLLFCFPRKRTSTFSFA